MDDAVKTWPGAFMLLLSGFGCILTEKPFEGFSTQQSDTAADRKPPSGSTAVRPSTNEPSRQASLLATNNRQSIDESRPDPMRLRIVETKDSERGPTQQEPLPNEDGLVDRLADVPVTSPDDAGVFLADSGSGIDAARINQLFPSTDANAFSCSGVVFNDSCYELFEQRVTHLAATLECNALGGHLPFIETQDESNFLTELAQPLGTGGTSGVWLGARNAASDGNVQWEDGTALTFSNFADDEPNNPLNPQCVIKNNAAGLWFDVSCALERVYFCELPRG